MKYTGAIKRLVKTPNLHKEKIIRIEVVLAIVVIGIVLLGLSRAATTSYSVEPESSGNRMGSVSDKSDPLASGKSAVEFGLPPPNSTNYISRGTTTGFVNPIHFIDAYANHPAPFNRIETDMVVEAEGGTDGYYFSSFLFFPNTPSCTPSCYAYMGLQTVGGKSLPPGGTVDKMAIFSVWNSTYSVPAAGVTPINFDGEGVGRSLRIAYPWEVGKTYRLIMGNDPARTTASATYWSASIVDVSSGHETKLGSVLMPSGMTQASSSVAFHERYSGQTTNCAQMNPSQVKFSNIRSFSPELNGGSWAKIDSWGILQADVTDCNSRFWAKDLPGAAIRSGINTPVQ